MKYLKLYESFIKLIKESFDSLTQFGFTEDDINELKNMKPEKPGIFPQDWKWDLPNDKFKNFCLNNVDKFNKFFKFKCKEISEETLKYWNRAYKIEHQEYIHLVLLYNELIIGQELTYSIESVNISKIVLSGGEDIFDGNPKARYKLYSFLFKGGYWWDEKNHDLWKNDNQEVDSTQLKSPSGKIGNKSEIITKDKEEPVSGAYWNVGYLTDESNEGATKMQEMTPEERDEYWSNSTHSFLGKPNPKLIVLIKKGDKYFIMDGGHRCFLASWLDKAYGKKIDLQALVIS